MLTLQEPAHVVGIVGAAVSGSVAAEALAAKGILVLVFEQNERPYGKIEDGLPRWHAKQRQQERERIDARLDRPGVHFIPRTRLGRDVDFVELARGWGLSALLLANGAWRDRPLDVPGIGEHLGRGLVYQNALVQWWNHKDEAGYSGPRFEIPDAGAAVVGGGLASVDVAKICQLELYGRALAARGIAADPLELEHEGIPEFLAGHGIADPRSLGVRDTVLVYRRRAEDMPLAPLPEGATPEQRTKAEATRRKILEKVQGKFLFRFEERRLPARALVEEGRLRGLALLETRVEGKRADAVPGSETELRADLVVGSIGSVPEKIPGIETDGELYRVKDRATGEYAALPGVYAIGNVVTGQGNIRVSHVHGQSVAGHLVENYLGVGDSRHFATNAEGDFPAIDRARESASGLATLLSCRAKVPAAKATRILERVRGLQERAGYTGDYRTWIASHTPPDLR